MKKIIFLLGITFLLQSCFTYKNFDDSPGRMTVGKTYKIQRNKKCDRLKIKAITEREVIATNAINEVRIPISEITKIQSRKFSVLKTAALPVIVVGGLVGLASLAWD